MAQTQSHQLPPQSFSPPISSPSPGAQSPVAGIPPPPKRQRLSPLPQPQSTASPSFGTLQLPKVGSPIAGTPPNGLIQQQKPMNAPPPPGSMGPPSRPVEKATDAAELTDVLASSGIDVREEEAFLTSDYGKQQQQQQQQQQQPQPPQPPRINTALNTSFASQPSITSTVSAGNSFADQTPKQPAIKPAPYAQTGPAPPPIKTEEMMRDEKLREDTAASRREQYHLQASFLQTALVEKKLEKRCVEHGVRLPVAGVFRPLPGRQPGPLEITGPDGSSIVRRDKTLLTPDSPLGDIISLLSLASEERLRSVVDHSATLARNRRVNSHGLAPPEWSNLVASAQHAPDNASDAKDKPQATPLSLAIKSRRLIDKDESFEEGRAAKRAKRNADAILGNENRADSVGASTPNGATPTAQVSERAPDVEKKSSKKDMKKQDAKATGAVQHQHAVETARMSIQSNFSSRFGKKGGYSWLQTAQPAAASRSGFSTPTRQNTAAGAPTTNGASKPSGVNRNAKVPGRRLGDWREDDKEGGAGIQLRDLLFMLEEDGRGLKHLQKAYSKDPKEDTERPAR